MRGIGARARVLVWSTIAFFASGCEQDSQSPDPFVEDFGIAYVGRPLALDDDDNLEEGDLRRMDRFRAGGDLYFRDLAAAGAAERNLTIEVTEGLGDVRDVEVSYEGDRLLFALRLPEIEGLPDDEQPSWNIWEYDLTENTLRRVIASDLTAEEGDDLAPSYLPDGRIVFTSDRQRQSRALLLDEGKPQFPAQTEDRAENAFVLHVMNADGSDLHQISFNQSHDRDPTVLATGEVLFTRWDNMGGRNEMSLYRMRPDGAALASVYGTHSHNTGTDGATVQFSQPRELADGRVLSIVRPYTGSEDAGDVQAITIADYTDNETPTAVNAGALSGPAQERVVENDVRTDTGLSPGGRFQSAYPLADGTGRMLVSWNECRLQNEEDRILPCTEENLADDTLQAALPLFGIYIYDPNDATQRPVFQPVEGMEYVDVVVAKPRDFAEVISDGVGGVDLDAELVDEGVGVLHIRSVYDFDGSFNALGSSANTLAALSDPSRTTADERAARFVRIVKAVSMPDRDVTDIPGTAFGRSSAQLMRELIGYVPVEPDGSAKFKVPANVAFAVSVVDADGQRIGGRHQNWLQLRAGEVRECNGCHDHASGLPHGRPEAEAQSINAGATSSAEPFPNANPDWPAEFGESMAETRTRLAAAALNPSVDLIFSDIWTDPAQRMPDADLQLLYADVPAAPVSPACQTQWDVSCRVVIHYEEHLQPLWDADRGADSCTLCHNTVDDMANVQVPEAQLDLTSAASDQEPDHYTSYRELLFTDNEQELDGTSLVDRLVDGPIDPDTGLPTQVTVPVNAVLSTAGARSSSGFFDLFAAGGSHAGRLSAAELRLVAEWLDIGAQYQNDPFLEPAQ